MHISCSQFLLFPGVLIFKSQMTDIVLVGRKISVARGMILIINLLDNPNFPQLMFPKYHQESEGSFFSANESPKRLYVGCLPAQLMNAREYLSLKIEATLCLFPNQMLSISQEHPVMCCREHNPVSKLFLPKNHISIFKQSIDWCLGLSTIACPISDNGSCCRELL